MTTTLRTVFLLSLLCACAACGKPERPKKDEPPEPQATELRDTIQRPIEKARTVEPQVLDKAEQDRKAIEDQGG